MYVVYRSVTQRILSTYIVECRVSIKRIAIMVWAGIPHVSTWDHMARARGSGLHCALGLYLGIQNRLIKGS